MVMGVQSNYSGLAIMDLNRPILINQELEISAIKTGSCNKGAFLYQLFS